MPPGWDYADVPRLVAHLSPPMCPKTAEQALRQIYRRLSRARYGERQAVPMKQTKAQLRALERALAGLGLRGEEAVVAALDGGPLDDFMPYPYRKVRVLMDNPTRPDLPAWKMSGALLLLMLKRAAARAPENIQKLSTSSSDLSEAARQAVRELVDLFCAGGNRPRPYYSREHKIAKHNGALIFAYECLVAWGDPDVIEVSADELVWCVYSD
jgi:hypothetical protein